MYDYKSKLITPEQALGFVKSGDYIVTGLGSAEAQLFFNSLHTVADRVKDVTVSNCLPMSSSEFIKDEKYFNSFYIETWFYTPLYRKMHSKGRISYMPNNLHFAGSKRITAKPCNILVMATSMPDENGNVSLSVSNTYEVEFMEIAEKIIFEINPNYPWVDGDHIVNLASRDNIYVVESDYPVPVLPDVPFSDKDAKIGKFIADYVKDGDCVQVGIGGIPNAVTNELFGKKDLGVHTEMMTTGIMRLMKAGVVNNSKKQADNGKTVATFAMGTPELYEFMNHNPDIILNAGCLVNDPYYIARNENQVSINTCIEIDLTGQCSSEGMGHVQFSGSGGQADTAIGAQNSKGGRSFIALYSTADAKNADGTRTTVSKVVPMLKPGAAVTLSRNDVDYVVTEYGVAHLKGLSIKERVPALIKIAHPDFRAQLWEEAKKLEYVFGDYKAE